ncbi:MAG: MFS transporter [Verrucomicrobium sp.]|nr:MFS transporter [Verrucomicrobium sp.]
MTTAARINSPRSPQTPWGLYLGIVLIGANLRAPITSLGPVLPEIQDSLSLGGFGAGLLHALPLLLFALLSLAAPRAGRRYGLERILAGAVAVILAGTVLRSLPFPGLIWIGTGLIGAGIAFGNVLLPGLVKREFPARAAGLIGLYAAAMAGCAGLAAGLAGPISHLPGSSWRWAIGCWAALALVTLMVWLPQGRKRQHHLADAAPETRGHTSPWRHPIGWQVSLFFAMHSLVFYSIVDWYASYAASAGIAADAAGIYLLFYQVIAIGSNLGSASLIKKLGDQRLLGLACGLFLLAGTLGMLWSPAHSLLWLASAGLGAGIALVTNLSLFALRTRNHHQAARLSGMAQFIGYAGGAAGPLLVGILHDATHGWSWPLGMLVIASGLAGVFATLAGRPRFIE